MREGWTYKKFAEVFDLQMGKTPSRDNPLFWNGQNTWVSIADLQNKYIGSSKEKITEKAVSESNIKIVKKGTVIMSFKLTVGRCAIAAKDLYTNEAIMSFTPLRDGVLLPEFIYYNLKGYKWLGANKAVMGMTLNKKSISSNVFAYPPLSEQQRIVSELDLLSGIIEKKKAQLKDYDQLAQSIFYDMFGDPMENPKGWEVKKLGELCSLITKGTTPTTIRFPFVDEGVNFVKVESFVDGRIDNSKLSHITHECNLALTRSKLQNKDLLVCIAGTIGKMAVVDSSILPANTNQACAILRLKDNKIIRYIQSYLELKFEYDVKQMGKGVAQPNLSLGQLRNLLILMPPIEQRECFKTKIEAIEKQKELIKKSIAETETLFNSRMDYYFN